MLPVELVDHIFGHFDRHTLEVSGKAHPFLLHVAERHLYANITLHNELDYRASDRTLALGVPQLLDLLSSSPHVAAYVRNLTILVNRLDVFLDEVASILPLFSQLRSINLTSTIRVYYMRWPELPESFQVSFVDCLRLPSMKEVSFFGAEIPLSIFDECRSLKKLKLDVCNVSDGDLLLESPCPPLESLSVINASSWSLRKITSWAMKHPLRSFVCAQDPTELVIGSVGIIAPLLRSCADSLTSLELDLKGTYNIPQKPNSSTDLPPEYSFPTLPTFSQLQRLSIHAHMTSCYNSFERSADGGQMYLSTFPALAKLLATVPNDLEHLVFHLHFHIGGIDSLAKADWSDLESFLMTSCSTLRVISLHISISSDRSSLKRSPDDILHSLARYTYINKLVKQRMLFIVPEKHCSHRFVILEC